MLSEELGNKMTKRIDHKLLANKRKRISQKDVFNNISRFFVKRGLVVENPSDIFSRITK